MVKKKNISKNISKSTSEKSCVFCLVSMERRTRTAPPQGKKYYYTAWDVCPLCRRIFHYPEFMCEAWKQDTAEYTKYQKKSSKKTHEKFNNKHRRINEAVSAQRKETDSVIQRIMAKQAYRQIKDSEDFWMKNP